MAYKLFLFLSITLLPISVKAQYPKVVSSFNKDVTITMEQQKKLEQFKNLVADKLPQEYMKGDLYLLKFLRSRDFDVKAATAFLEEVMQWRKENNIDSILSEDFSDMKDSFKYVYLKDKFGQPASYVIAGGINVRREVVSGKIDRLMRFSDHAFEEFCTIIRKAGDEHKNVTRGNSIVNLSGYNLVEIGCLRCIPLFMKILVDYDRHFPECIDKIILVNVPSVFSPFLEAAKPLVSRSRLDGLIVLGSNKKRNLEFFKSFMDMDEIPVSLGGRKWTEIDGIGENDY